MSHLIRFPECITRSVFELRYFALLWRHSFGFLEGREVLLLKLALRLDCLDRDGRLRRVALPLFGQKTLVVGLLVADLLHHALSFVIIAVKGNLACA